MTNIRPKVAIIIVNWNGYEDTHACARSLLAQDYEPVEIYLVDNASEDNSAARLAGDFPGFTHIARGTNEGFAMANNFAMERALKENASYVLLLNNDTVVAPNFLRHLVDAAQAEARIGMVVPKMYLHDSLNEIWFAGGSVRYNEWYPFKHIGEGEKDVGQFDVPGETDFATACCVLVRAELIREVGMFDPIFGFYCEDVDWSLRARRAGWQLRYEPRARIWHRVNRSMERARIDPLYYSCRNVAIIARRHLPWPKALSLVWLTAISTWEYANLEGPSRAALIEAARDAVLGRTGILAEPGSSLFAQRVIRVVDSWLRIQRIVTWPFRIVAHFYRKVRGRRVRQEKRAQLKMESKMRIAINIDGQFQPMTGIQHYVDSLLGALLASGTRHEITAFAPALFGAALFEQHAREGSFAWRDHPRIHVDSAGSDRPFASSRFGRLPFRGGEGAYARSQARSAGRRARVASSRYDLLHVPCPVPLPFESYRARYCIATIYDLTPRLFPETHEQVTLDAWERLFRFAQDRCSRVLTISEWSRRDIVEHLQIDPDRIDVTPLAPRVSTRRVVDANERAAALRSLNLNPNVPFVLYAGTLEPRKNLDRLLEAFAIAMHETHLREHQLVLAGGYGGGYDQRVRTRATHLGLGARVHLTGYVSNAAMNALMSACEVFAYISEYEGFGLPPLEAMVCGAPVLASNAASLPEVIGDAGVLVHPHDVSGTAAGLARLLTDPFENTRLRAAAMQRASEFTWAKTAELTLHAYEAAVASPEIPSWRNAK